MGDGHSRKRKQEKSLATNVEWRERNIVFTTEKKLHIEAKKTNMQTGNNIQLCPEVEVNSGGYIPRREASRYISTALHRP